MSDREIRLLERRVAEGDEGAEVPLLRARVRAGLVTEERLNTAARLGDATALAAGGAGPSIRWSDPYERDRVFAMIPPWDLIALLCRWGEPILALHERMFPREDQGLGSPRYLLSIAQRRAEARSSSVVLGCGTGPSPHTPMTRALIDCVYQASQFPHLLAHTPLHEWASSVSAYGILIGREGRLTPAPQRHSVARLLLTPWGD